MKYRALYKESVSSSLPEGSSKENAFLSTSGIILALLCVSLLLASCRGQISHKPPIHPNLNMDFQNRFEGQERNPFFEDNRSMRQPVEGTVARGQLKHDKVFFQGINDDSSFVEHAPVDYTKAFIYHGKDRFEVYCTPCHGYLGDGKGIVTTGGFGFVPAPSYHTDRIRNMPDGELFSVITNGVRTMPAYNTQIPVKDRWAIVAYIRALQKSQDIPENNVKKYDVDLASLKEDFRKKQEEKQAQKESQAAAAGGGEISVEKGKQLAQDNACVTCHSTDGSKMTGPSWKDLYGHEVEMQDGTTVTADENYITESIMSSQAKIVKGYQGVMPNFDYLSDTDVKSLIAYIKTLSNKANQ